MIQRTCGAAHRIDAFIGDRSAREVNVIIEVAGRRRADHIRMDKDAGTLRRRVLYTPCAIPAIKGSFRIPL